MPTRWNPNRIPEVVEITTGKTLDKFESNDVEKVDATLLYDGGEDKDGQWCIQEVETNAGLTTIRFATQLNNPSITTYSAAWAARASLTYGLFSEAF